MPFCISILTSVRRIVKIAVRFSHTKTALCDRKDTQSHFVVNAARSIVCVGTSARRLIPRTKISFQCRTQHCVCRDIVDFARSHGVEVSMPHAALCVSGHKISIREGQACQFQCRTQHCVCRDKDMGRIASDFKGFNAARSIVCVGTERQVLRNTKPEVSMPHAALCVSGLCVPQPLSRAG